MLETALNKGPYELGNPLYAYTRPSEVSKDKLGGLLWLQGIELTPEEEEKLHMTIMWSTTPVRETPFTDYENRDFLGVSKEYQFWDGHDKEGYLVLVFGACETRDEHDKWKLRGATPSFETYEPHMTLVTGDRARALKHMHGQPCVHRFRFVGHWVENANT